jgi:hypothetical protein
MLSSFCNLFDKSNRFCSLPKNSLYTTNLIAILLFFQVTGHLLLFFRFGQSSNTIFYLHEDGLAHAITTENDPKINLVKINKEMYHVTFNLSLGFLKRHDDFYKLMSNRTIIVATQNVSIYLKY